MPAPVALEIRADGRTFASGLLVDIVRALQQVPAGELLAIVGSAGLDADLQAWSALTGHAIIEQTSLGDEQRRWVVRHGVAEGVGNEEARTVGERLWLYTNFDCNLSCDYCCVRSSPGAPRRALGLERVTRIAEEAPPLGVRAFFVTGGEPFILPDIADIVITLAGAAPVTLLTNGMLFKGSRLASLQRLSRERVTLQISLDSPTPELHDSRRGAGSWEAAWHGVQLARREGFRVRLAASVSTGEQEQAFVRFLDAQDIPEPDRVVRRIARRGLAATGVVLAKSDLVPELTITTDGVFWHPVGAEDADLLVTTALFPLASAFALAREAFARHQEYGQRMARVFHCA